MAAQGRTRRQRERRRRRTGYLAALLLTGAIGWRPVAYGEQPATATLASSATATESTNTADGPPAASADDVSLDDLLDLADKAPERLQSIGVQEPPRTSSAAQETLFDPATASGAGATSTGGLLSQAPGVVIRSTSALNQDVRIRGYSGSQLVGVADGMNQGKTRLDIDSLFSQIDPNLVESITVIPGPYTVEYGPGYSFFVADLIRPERSDGLKFTSHTYFGWNANGRQIAWRETAGYAAPRAGALVSFGQRQGGDYRPGGASNDFKVPAAYHSQDLFVALSHDLGDVGRLDFHYIRQDLRDTLLPGVAYDINRQHADQLNLRGAWRDDVTGTERLRTQFWWNQAAYSADSSRLSKRLTFGDRLLAEPNPDLAGGGTVVGDGLSDNWGARLISAWGEQETGLLRAGVDWRRSRQFYREQDFMFDGSPALLGDTFGIPDSSSDDFGVFAGLTLAMTDRWTVGVGQRVDWVRYDVDPADLVATSTQFTPNGEYYAGFDSPTRVLSTTYLTSGFQAGEATTINAGVAFAMRPPNATELYSDQPYAPLVRFGNSFAFGDAELKSEQNLQFDLGFTTAHEQTTWGARVFHSTIHNYIGLASANYGTFPQNGVAPPGTLGRGLPFMPDPNVPNTDLAADSASLGYVYRNIDRATLYGVDLSAEHQIRPWLEAAASLTYTRGVNHDPVWVDVYAVQEQPLGGSEGLPGIYPLGGTLLARLVEPLDRRWTVEWQSRFVARQDYLATSLGELGTPGFAVHNLHASYRWTDAITVRSSLLNLFDRNYFEHNSLAIVDRDGNIGFVKNPGLSWFLGLDCKF